MMTGFNRSIINMEKRKENWSRKEKIDVAIGYNFK